MSFARPSVLGSYSPACAKAPPAEQARPPFTSRGAGAAERFRGGAREWATGGGDRTLAVLNWASLFVLIALVVVVILFALRVVASSPEARALLAPLAPQDANQVDLTLPVLIIARGLAQPSFFASDNAGGVALTTALGDYAAAVRLLPVKQQRPGVLSDGDAVRLLFARDGAWLGADGKLGPTPASILVSTDGKGSPVRTADLVRLSLAPADGGAPATGTDAVAGLFTVAGSRGAGLLPFLNGTGC